MPATMILRMNEGDSTVDLALTRLKKKYSSATVVLFGQVARLGNLKKGDQLIVLGHGNTSSLGKKSAKDLADAFAKADMPSGVLIDLVACNSGTGGAPLALELKTQLVSHKIVPGKVTGGTNYMWVKPDGTAFAKDKAHNEVTAGKQTVNTPWGQRTRNVDPTYRTGG